MGFTTSSRPAGPSLPHLPLSECLWASSQTPGRLNPTWAAWIPKARRPEEEQSWNLFCQVVIQPLAHWSTLYLMDSRQEQGLKPPVTQRDSRSPHQLQPMAVEKILLFMCFESSLAIKLFFASPYVQFWQALVPVCQIPVRRINLQPLQLRSPQSSSPSPASHLLKPEAPSRASGRAEPCLEENQGQFNKQRWKLFENVVTQMTIANINICGEVLLYLPSWKSERIAWTV